MKIQITPEAKTELVNIRTEIAGIITNYEAANTELTRMKADRPAYASAILELEDKTHHADESGIAALVTKRAQLTLIESKIPRVETTIANLPNLLYSRLGHTKSLIGAAVRPALEQLKREVTESLRPHFGAGPGLADVVNHSPIVASFEAFFIRDFAGGPLNAIQYAPNALEILDELISGKTSWDFKKAE